MSKGKLYLIPASLGNNTTHTLPKYGIEIAHGLKTFVAERAKTARHFLKALKTPVPFDDMTFHELNKKTPHRLKQTFLDAALKGENIGLLSEAGCPGVADPGAEIVAIAHQKGIEVVPLVGPSSILLALMASGLNGQNFAFVGYLGIKKVERTKDLKRLETLAMRTRQTQIFIETPYRNHALVDDMLRALSPNIRMCIAVDLTLPTEWIQMKTIQEWRKTEIPDLHKRPAIFLIG